MKVDILRQLDEWGTHIDAGIDHVSTLEIAETVATPSGEVGMQPTRPWWRTSIRLVGAAAVFLAIVIALPGMLGGTVSTEFSSIGSALGLSSNDRPVVAAPTTAAPPLSDTAQAYQLSRGQEGVGDLGFQAPSTEAPTTTAVSSTTAAPSGTTIPPAGRNPSELGRAVVFIGDLAIDTDDVSAAVTQARAIVEARGGYVFGQELGGSATVVSLKVPAEFFQDTIDRLSQLGTVRNARITSQDVTERIVDLESQIVTAETSVTRLQALLGEANTIGDITRIESELLARETSLERLRGQLRTVQDQVSLSTIVVTIRQFVAEPNMTVAVTVHPTDGGDGDDCFTESNPRIARDAEYVFCVDVRNTGNLELTDIKIDGPADLLADLRPASGNRKASLAPGERYVLWTTGVAVDPVREEVTARAVPLDENGERLVVQTTEDRAQLRITIRSPEPVPEVEPDGLPSLGDALSNGWSVLTTAVNAVAVAAAFVLPLVWLPLLVLVLVVWWRRRRS